MADAAALNPLGQPRRLAELAPGARQFKAYKSLFGKQESGRVEDLAFSPADPHQLAVCSGTKVGIWQPGKNEPLEIGSSLSKFKDLVQCVAWRDDGKLVLAGEASGSCAVVEPTTKRVLRRFFGHGEDAVSCASFAAADKGSAATGGRDGKLRIWDVAAGALVRTVDAHSDRVKILRPGPGGSDGWISAGYDGHVRLWDLRAASAEGGSVGSGCVMDFDHGHAVESGAVFPGGMLFASAGGPALKVWDMLAGGASPVKALPDAHSKTIMGVDLNNDASVLLTASFDGLAKAYMAADLSHLWTYKLSGPATCVSWRPDGLAFAVGLDDGRWQLRQRRTPGDAQVASQAKAVTVQPAKPRAKRVGHLRGLDSTPGEDDEVIDMERQVKRKKETQLDFLLRKFDYRKAIEFVVMPSTSAALGLAAVEELLRRGALGSALHELGEDLCLVTLRWLLKAPPCLGRRVRAGRMEPPSARRRRLRRAAAARAAPAPPPGWPPAGWAAGPAAAGAAAASAAVGSAAAVAASDAAAAAAARCSLGAAAAVARAAALGPAATRAAAAAAGAAAAAAVARAAADAAAAAAARPPAPPAPAGAGPLLAPVPSAPADLLAAALALAPALAGAGLAAVSAAAAAAAAAAAGSSPAATAAEGAMAGATAVARGLPRGPPSGEPDGQPRGQPDCHPHDPPDGQPVCPPRGQPDCQPRDRPRSQPFSYRARSGRHSLVPG
ncbi:unnamed protein product [Prorocentrum cordatum]|uniref:U3 small nucleolar RNA-associated protein 15 C-terminal domain-containing protein n=1 Tax=Prorocentrum cordatum TaxID=2364126 RepID=A0ABN9WMD3_9DINO|nr:unnamed protein product [Polarella glacialis]